MQYDLTSVPELQYNIFICNEIERKLKLFDLRNNRNMIKVKMKQTGFSFIV